MMELILLNILMKDIEAQVKEVTETIIEGKISGLEARIAVDSIIAKSYSTRAGVLDIIKANSAEVEKVANIANDIIEWTERLIKKAKEADELLGEFKFSIGGTSPKKDSEEEEDSPNQCEGCPMEEKCKEDKE